MVIQYMCMHLSFSFMCPSNQLKGMRKVKFKITGKEYGINTTQVVIIIIFTVMTSILEGICFCRNLKFLCGGVAVHNMEVCGGISQRGGTWT